MPSDGLLQAMNRVHRGLLRLSGGMLGWRLKGMPVLELTTVGRTTGLARAVMLTAPVRDGDTFVIVASRGGDDRHPSWFLNLIEHPEVKVKLAGWSEISMRPAWCRLTNAPRFGRGSPRRTADMPAIKKRPRA